MHQELKEHFPGDTRSWEGTPCPLPGHSNTPREPLVPGGVPLRFTAQCPKHSTDQETLSLTHLLQPCQALHLRSLPLSAPAAHADSPCCS